MRVHCTTKHQIYYLNERQNILQTLFKTVKSYYAWRNALKKLLLFNILHSQTSWWMLIWKVHLRSEMTVRGVGISIYFEVVGLMRSPMIVCFTLIGNPWEEVIPCRTSQGVFAQWATIDLCPASTSHTIFCEFLTTDSYLVTLHAYTIYHNHAAFLRFSFWEYKHEDPNL